MKQQFFSKTLVQAAMVWVIFLLIVVVNATKRAMVYKPFTGELPPTRSALP